MPDRIYLEPLPMVTPGVPYRGIAARRPGQSPLSAPEVCDSPNALGAGGAGNECDDESEFMGLGAMGACCASCGRAELGALGDCDCHDGFAHDSHIYEHETHPWGDLGAPMTFGAPVQTNTWTIHAPLLQSPTDLNLVVDRVVSRIEAGGNWTVVSYSVVSGAVSGVVSFLPTFLQPSVQWVKFIVRRKDGGGSTLNATSIVLNAAAAENLTLGAVKDWAVELKTDVIDPSIPTAPNTCDAIKRLTGVSCKTWAWIGAGVGTLYALSVLTNAKRAFLGGTSSRGRRR